MNLTTEFRPIRLWAEEKGILANGDIKTQTLKLQEEVGELAKAVIEQDPHEIKDAIGDCIVVLTSIAYMAGKTFYMENISIEECINAAYWEIKNRKGKMDNGTFIKDKTIEDEDHNYGIDGF